MVEKKGNICYHCMQLHEDENTACPFCGFDITNPQTYPYERKNHVLPAGSILSNRFIVGSVILDDHFELVYTGIDLYTEQKVFIHEFFPSELVMRDNKVNFQVSVISQEDKKIFQTGKGLFKNRFITTKEKIQHTTIENVISLWEENETVYMTGEAPSFVSLDEMLQSQPFNQHQETYYAILHSVKDCLAAFHQEGTSYCEIKPERIFVGNKQVVLLAGGIEKYEFAKTFSSKLIIPDKRFCSPNLIAGQCETTDTIDMYAFSSLCYYIITSADSHTYNRKKLSKTAKKWNIPPFLTTAIAEGLSPDAASEKKDFSGYVGLNDYVNIPLEISLGKRDLDMMHQEEKSKKTFQPKKMLIILITFLLLLIIFYFISGNSVDKPRKENNNTALPIIPTAEVTSTPAITSTPIVIIAPTPTVSPTPTAVPTPEPTPTVTPIPSPITTKKPAPKSTPTPIPSKKTTVRPNITQKPITHTAKPTKKTITKPTEKVAEEKIEGID